MQNLDGMGEEAVIGRTTVAGARVLSPSSSLTFELCGDLGSALESAFADSARVVVIDCRSVSSMDSEAMELLVHWAEKMRGTGGELRLTHLNDVCSDILVATRLVHTLVVRNDINAAVRSD